MPTDVDLLGFYLNANAPEAGRWNGSPEALFLELAIRSEFRADIEKRSNTRVLNVGIGTGGWDDFLGYWLEDRGQLVSLDRDREVCALLRYRQRREGHPYPALVLRGDLF